jgi:hypothetical protein
LASNQRCAAAAGREKSVPSQNPRTVPTGDFDIVMDKTDFKEGEQSLKFVVRKCDARGGRLSPGFFNEFHVENHNPPGPFENKPGETYKITFWAKNAGSEFVFKARGVSALEGDPGVVIRSKETIDEWRRFERTYTIPPKMWLRLELNVVQPGTFWIDDIQIVTSDGGIRPPPLLPNDRRRKTPDDPVGRIDFFGQPIPESGQVRRPRGRRQPRPRASDPRETEERGRAGLKQRHIK